MLSCNLKLHFSGSSDDLRKNEAIAHLPDQMEYVIPVTPGVIYVNWISYVEVEALTIVCYKGTPRGVGYVAEIDALRDMQCIHFSQLVFVLRPGYLIGETAC